MDAAQKQQPNMVPVLVPMEWRENQLCSDGSFHRVEELSIMVTLELPGMTVLDMEREKRSIDSYLLEDPLLY